MDTRNAWVRRHVGKILRAFEATDKQEPFIPVGAPLDYVPKKP